MSTAYMFYPEDWVPVIDIERKGLCPRSIYNDRRKFAAWLRTGEIPPGTPELKRAVRIVDVGEQRPDAAKGTT